MSGGRRAASGRGFSLIELLIVVAIVGILAGVAWPSYRETVLDTRRGDARASLLGYAQQLERCYSETHSYQGCPSLTSSNQGYYALAIQLLDGGAGYRLTATPQAGGPQQNDGRCSEFRLSHTGARGASGSQPDRCW